MCDDESSDRSEAGSTRRDESIVAFTRTDGKRIETTMVKQNEETR